MKKTKAVYSKLISLSKEILINFDNRLEILETSDKYWEVIEWVSPQQSILLITKPEILKRDPLIKKRWAISKKGYGEIIDLAKMLIEEDPSIEFGDFRDACEYIVARLKDTAYTQDLYNLNIIKQNTPCQLFDTVLPDPITWASNITILIQNHLRMETENILILMSLPCNIISQSFHLGFKGLRVVNITEDTILQEINSKYLINGFSKKYFSRWTNDFIRDSLETNLFISFEGKLNKTNVSEYAREHTDIFLSVLIAFHSKDQPNNICPSMKETKSVVITCFEKGSRSPQTTGFIDNPLFYSATEIQISPEILLNMRKWWDLYGTFSTENQSKIKNGLSFFIRGLTGTEIFQYSNLYLFLDSIYGQNGRVENAIKDNILKKIQNYPERLLGIFWDIRCEILHGGINRLYKWNNFSKFLKEYSSDPIRMLRSLCCEIICNGIY